MIKAVIFDLDDTLYDEAEYCKSGFAAVAQFLADKPSTPSAEIIFAALWDEFSTRNRTNTFDGALVKLGINYDCQLIEKLVSIYRTHLPNLTLPQDSMDVLLQLKQKYTLALLTDGFLPAQRLKVEALGVEKFFASTIYTEELGREFWKPSTAGFEKLLKTLDVKPENAVYVADNEQKDFIGPNAMGLVTIQLIRPAGIHREVCNPISGAAAKYKIVKIGQLPDLLKIC